MVTINYHNASINLAENVYDPAEDSYLLADAALDYVKDGMSVLEIGAGTGFVSAVIKANRDIRLLATEISPFAALCARSNGIDVIRTDMFAGLKARWQFDIIIFNPPYLPTSEEEKVPGWLNYAFDGGTDGRREINRFIRQAGSYLKKSGIILLLISSLSGTEPVARQLREEGFEALEVAAVKCSFEKLIVLKIEKK